MINRQLLAFMNVSYEEAAETHAQPTTTGNALNAVCVAEMRALKTCVERAFLTGADASPAKWANGR